MRTLYVVLLGGLAVTLLVGSASAQNLLVNPSFEDPPYGDFVDPVWAPTGWLAPPTESWQQWQGVYDSTWKNPNCNYPTWPDPVHTPVDGSYFIGHWFPPLGDWYCEYDNDHMAGRSSYVYQTVTGLTPGTTYYFSGWYATQHPHQWGLFRLVCLPQTYDPGSGTFDPAIDPTYPIYTPNEENGYLQRVAAPAEEAGVEDPENPGSTLWPHFTANWAGSNEHWSKITADVQLGPTQNAATLFVAFQTSGNNISEPQYVQADSIRFSTTQTLEITDVQFTSFTATSATLEWNVRDGDNMLYDLTGTDCYVEYGPTSSYGSTQPAVATNPYTGVWCDATPGRYRAVISGLTEGATYHFRIVVAPGVHGYVPPYDCAPYNPDPVPGTRDYEGRSTADATFEMLPLLTITNVQASGITQTSAVVSWVTNVAADSRVNYGMFGLIDSSTSDAALTTAHSMTLTDLAPGTSYTSNVQSQAAGWQLTTSPNSQFTTLVGPDLMNGDFEFRAKTNTDPKYWTKVPGVGGGTTYPSFEWSVPAQNGQWYFGSIANGSGNFANPARYQQIAATPGQIISLYAWSYANGYAIDDPDIPGDDCLGGPLHRFGENNNKIGIDPNGGVPNFFGVPPASTQWSVPLSSVKFAKYWAGNHCDSTYGPFAEWRRLGFMVKAGSTGKVTVFLGMDSWYKNGWVLNFFDNVYLEPPTAISSVSELKNLPLQTNVQLTEPPTDGYVVTYIDEFPDMWENETQAYFYIEDADRAAGIKVTLAPTLSWPSWLAVGKKVNILGTSDWGAFYNYTHEQSYAQQLRMNNPSGEPVLRAIEITDAGDGTVPAPVGVTNQSLGGSSTDAWISNPGVSGGSGANNVGLRVRTWGKIMEIGYDDNYEIYLVIDDGSKLPLPDQTVAKPTLWPRLEPGLYVPTRDYTWPTLGDGSAVQVGDYVILTGISGVRLDLDWEDLIGWPDPNDGSIIIPEAMKNVRAIKIEPDGATYFRP